MLYLSFYFTFCWSSETTVALALNSSWGCCNETFSFHNFLPNPAMHDLFTCILTLQFSHFCR